MKPYRFYQALILVAVLSFVALPVAVFTQGCKTSQQKQTVNTLFTVGSGVDAAYKAYLDLVIKHEISTNTVPKVSRAYKNFQSAFNVAIVFTSGTTNAVVPQSVIDAATSFKDEVNKAKTGTP